MSTNTLALVLPGNRREVIKTTPTMTLGQVLADACARPPKPLGDASAYQLMNGKAVLDLSTPLRFAGLASGARLEVVRKPGAPAHAPAAPPAAAAPAAAPAASAPPAPATQPQPQPGADAGAASGSGACAAGGCDAAPMEGTSGAGASAAADPSAGGGAAPAAGGDADAAAEAAPVSAEAVAAAAAAAAAADAVASRLGRRVRVYSRDALLRAGVAPAVDLPESFYECALSQMHTRIHACVRALRRAPSANRLFLTLAARASAAFPCLSSPPSRLRRFTPEDFHSVTSAAKRKEEAVMMTKAMRDAVLAKRASVRARTHTLSHVKAPQP
jgi:hypothetical protein